MDAVVDLSKSQSEVSDGCDDEDSIFDIGLNPAGDEGSSFRTQNDPAAPYQRGNLIERRGAIDIRCTCLDVIHGLLTPENFEELATLIVLKFNFDSRRRARRIATANIKIEFSSSEPNYSGPEVLKIAPFGSMAMVPTTAQKEEKRIASFTLGAPPLAGFQAGTELGWERAVTSETMDQTRIIGSVDLRGRNYGPPNSISWTLLENETQATGVPTIMRTAILLKRRNEAKFQCTVKIDAKVDWKSSLGRMIGAKPKDDPVLFDPELDPTNRLQTYDVLNIAAVDLEEIAGVSFMKVYDEPISNV
ncbi:uncharacterized protein BKA78DRAFT_308686 [Phyllosticta capitalensis]|uniref:uncharacterized protein n=1 Tax=Phyllosticta capitalensis TaxID=121624 RepID=UPI00312E859B